MKTYNMTLCNVDRTLPFIPISEDMAFASFVVLGDTELVSACAPALAKKIGNVDAIVTAEAKGIALAYEVSRQLGLKEFIVALQLPESSICIWMEKTPIRSVAKESACWMTSFLPENLSTHWSA